MTRKLRAIAGILAILLSSSILLFTLFPIPPSPDSAIDSAIGQALAQQTLPLIKSGGTIIILRPDTAEFPRPAFDILFTALQKQLRRAGAPTPAIRTFELDPLRPNEIPPGDFFQLLTRAPPDTVIVSLLGPPLLSADQRQQLSPLHPKLVAFCSGSLPARLNLGALFREGLLHSAVAAKYPPPVHAGRTFEQLYSVLNAANLAALGTPNPNN